MNNSKVFSLSALCLSLIACGSSGPGDPPVDNTNPPAVGNGNYKSSYCVDSNVVNEVDDTFVFIDAFSLAPDMPSSVENVAPEVALTTSLLYSRLPLAVSTINLVMAFGPIFSSAFCSADILVDNKCDFVVPDFGDPESGLRATGGVLMNTLSFDVFVKSAGTNLLDLKASNYTGDLTPYWAGAYTTFADPADSESEGAVMSWRRDGSAETVSIVNANGDYMTATEQRDCSGTLSTQDTLSSGTIITVEGSWQLNGTTTTGKVTRCFGGNCESLSW